MLIAALAALTAVLAGALWYALKGRTGALGGRTGDTSQSVAWGCTHHGGWPLLMYGLDVNIMSCLLQGAQQLQGMLRRRGQQRLGVTHFQLMQAQGRCMRLSPARLLKALLLTR